MKTIWSFFINKCIIETSLLNIRDENHLSIWLNRFNHRNKIKCQVKNQGEINNQSIVLQLICFHFKSWTKKKLFIYLDKPIFFDKNDLKIKNSSIILVDKDEKVEFECFVDSFPQSSIWWTFN